MVAYTTAFLAAANLLALVHAAPAQPVCFAVTTVITGTPVWVPRADPTTGPGWGPWPQPGSPSASTTARTTVSTTTRTAPIWSSSTTTARTTWTTASSSGGGFYPVTSSTIPLTTITLTPTPDVPTTSTAAPTTSAPAPPPAAPTCAATGTDVFNTSPSGSCDCDFTVSCNRHAPYTSSTQFWERTSGEIIGSLAECQSICNDNAECQAAIWVNKSGASDSEYLRCWQTSGLPQADSDGYGQLSYKGSCSGSCSQSYINH